MLFAGITPGRTSSTGRSARSSGRRPPSRARSSRPTGCASTSRTESPSAPTRSPRSSGSSTQRSARTPPSRPRTCRSSRRRRRARSPCSARSTGGAARPLGAALKEVRADAPRRYGDAVRDNPEPLVAFLASELEGGKLQMVCAVSQNLVARNWHAKEVFAQVARVVGGGGGGSPTLASGGGKDASKLPEAFALFEKLVGE